ncbi:MAG: hypothetical protein ACR2RF_24695 [Geminicoccaceae bacterium]
MSEDMVAISAEDDKLKGKTDACINARQKFVIVADKTFPHHEALIRWLEVYGGQTDKRGFFRAIRDNIAVGDISGIWAAATLDNDYSWDYAVTEDSITITLDPDPNALRPKLSAAFKNKPRQDHGALLEGSGGGDIPIISMHDKDIKKKIIASTSKRQPFVVHADRKVRHKKALLRWLRVYDGAPEERGFGRLIPDILLAGRFNAFMQIASDAGYAFSYRHTPELITIVFEPPENCPSRSPNET